jgi:hypothetical protein
MIEPDNWNVGILEYWGIARKKQKPIIIPLFHHFTIPVREGRDGNGRFQHTGGR